MADGDFNIDDYIISTDEGNGELILTKPEPVKAEDLQVEDKTPSLGTPDMYEGRFNSILESQQRQAGAISQLIKYVLEKDQKPDSLDQEALGEVFQDADKGSQFLSVITKQIEKIIDDRFGQLRPIVQQNQVQNELQQLMSTVPDLPEYMPGMHHLLGINPNLSFVQAYNMAKQYGWKVAKQPTNQPQQQPIKYDSQPNNVADINQRRNLPQKLESSNAELKTTEIKTVRDALEAALIELGA